MTARISIIVAAARNGVIGRNGGMPWRMPSDLKHFRALTLGKPVIMGRKTFQAIGKPLPGRDTIVVTRDKAFKPDGISIAASLEAAIAIANERATARGVEEIMIAGGGEIYRASLPRADRVYLTVIAATLDGDATFPPLPQAEWERTSERPMARTDDDDFDAIFTIFERR